MTAIKYWLATLSVFAFGGVTQSYVQPADARVKLSEVERACERALRQNSIEALENFLNKYPPDRYRNDVACYALALGALNEFGPQGKNSDEHTPSGNPGGYRQ
jgi:hypothetical protein